MITTKQNNLTYLLNKSNHTATIIGSFEAEGDIFIQRSIEYETQEYLITSVGERSFFNSHFIDSITFSDDSCLETIETKAFSHSSIYFIHIPSSLIQIKDKAFSDCDNLVEVEIPEDSNLTQIGKESFFCSSIESIFIPQKVTKICEKAFESCTYLKYVEISENSQLEYIGKCAFSWANIMSINFPEKLNFLDNNWCHATSYLTDVFISPLNENFKFIARETLMIVGKSEPNIEGYDSLVFVNRDSVNVEVPSFIKYIKSSAFSGCSMLETVCFQKNSQLTLIENDSFSHSSLVKIVIPSSLVRIGENAFGRCESLEKVEFEKNSQLKSIGKYIFSYSSIKEIVLPENLCEFDNEWCYNIFNLNSVSISPENKRISILNSKIILRKSDSKSDIFDEIIFACKDIKNVQIPSYVRYIKSCAFWNCSELETVEFESNSNLVSIEDNAFSSTNIKTICIPKTVKTIGKQAFYSCKNLEKIEIPEDSELLEINEFAIDVDLLKYFYIPSKVEKLHEKWNALSSKLKQICVSPENKNFKYADENKNMIIGKSNNESNCYDTLLFVNGFFDEIVIPSYIKHLNAFLFATNKKLKKIKIEKNSVLESVGVAAFRSAKLTNFCFPESTKIIEERVFEKCNFLISVEFLADEIKVDGYVFGFCGNVNIISFPNAKKIELAYDFIDPDYEYDSLMLFTYPSANIYYFASNFE